MHGYYSVVVLSYHGTCFPLWTQQKTEWTWYTGYARSVFRRSITKINENCFTTYLVKPCIIHWIKNQTKVDITVAQTNHIIAYTFARYSKEFEVLKQKQLPVDVPKYRANKILSYCFPWCIVCQKNRNLWFAYWYTRTLRQTTCRTKDSSVYHLFLHIFLHVMKGMYMPMVD